MIGPEEVEQRHLQGSGANRLEGQDVVVRTWIYMILNISEQGHFQAMTKSRL